MHAACFLLPQQCVLCLAMCSACLQLVCHHVQPINNKLACCCMMMPIPIRIVAFVLPLAAELRQDGVPRGAYRRTVQISWRKGAVHLYIAPAPGFKWVKPEGEILVDHSGAVKLVSTELTILLHKVKRLPILLTSSIGSTITLVRTACRLCHCVALDPL